MSVATILDEILPVDIGLPEKYTDFRQCQREIVDFALYGYGQDKRFTAISAPVGSGKSLAAQAAGRLAGVKYVVLTYSNALLDQNQRDFDGIIADVRGQANYQCVDSTSRRRVTCDEGWEYGCQWVGMPMCTHVKRVKAAQRSQAVSTNYAYWIHSRAMNSRALQMPSGASIDLLIADEAHKCFHALGSFLGVWVSKDDANTYGLDLPTRDLGDKEWAQVGPGLAERLAAFDLNLGIAMEALLARYDTRAEAYRDSDKFRALDRKRQELSRLLSHVADGGWIWHLTKAGVKFDCVWPYRYAERYLWSGVKKVVLISGTLRRKCLSLLGLDKDAYDYKEWPRQFPANLAPVYYYPVARMGAKSTDQDFVLMRDGVDEWHRNRRDRKTIIHTPSYKLAERFQAACECGRDMILSKPGDAAVAEKRYREADSPALLVAPSFMVGCDFPNEDCELILIPKIPFLSEGDPIVQARKSDPVWGNYEVAQTLQQACGRGARHEADRCESVIMDKAYGWWKRLGSPHFSRWFAGSVRQISEIPEPPPKM